MARRFRGSGRRRDVHWANFNETFLALSAGTVAAQIGLLPAGGHPETVVRIRGELMAFVDGAQAPGGLADVAVGVILAQEGLGTTVISSPITDADAPWLWFERFTLGYEEMVTDVVDVPSLTGVRRVIDNKAMRILRPDQELQVVAQNVTIGTAIAVNISVVGRILSQLG